jgi:hypothetical protein
MGWIIGGVESGGGGTELINQIKVTQASDLSGALSSTTEYFLDGIIDFTGTGLSIEIPQGGLNLKGYNFDISGIKCDDNSYTLFTSPVGGSGNLLGSDYLVDVNGTSSKVYDIVSDTGFEAFEFSRVNYNNCTSLGTIDNYRQGLEIGTGRFGGSPSLELVGAWIGGYRITTSIVRSLDAGMTEPLFKAGAAFVMQSRFLSDINVDLPTSAALLDFSPTNFPNSSTLQMTGAIVTRNGVSDATDSNLTPNIAASDLSCSWSDNKGLSNTFEGGALDITAEVTTTISVAGTFVDLAGTYTASELQHFDEPSNGQLRHLGASPVEYKVSGQLVIDASGNDEVDLKIVIFRDATTSFVDGKTIRRVINNLQGGRNVAYFGLSDNVILNTNDYVKLQVANVNDTTNITAELDSFFSVEER